jgi:hypothetical protein
MFALVATLRMSALVWRRLRVGKIFVAPLSLTAQDNAACWRRFVPDLFGHALVH